MHPQGWGKGQQCDGWESLSSELREKVEKFLLAVHLDVEYRALWRVAANKSIEKIGCCTFAVRDMRRGIIEDIVKLRVVLPEETLETPLCILFCALCLRLKQCLESASQQ